NHAIQYLPIPITDIILMKTTEKDRMEKLQMLMNKLDTLCTRNQEQKENIFSPDSLLVIPPANLTREINQSWENQQQLIGDQTSLEYILSCSNRLNNKQEEIQSILTRTTRIAKISSELYESYINEEEQLKNEWNDMCKLFEQKLIEKNDRLSRKFYQLFKEQTTINYDDKLQEQIRTFFSNSNENIQHLLNKEIPTRLTTYTRECYINVATCLQKRAYDTTNDIAIDMHKQLETTIFQAAASSQQTSATDVSQNTPSSTLDRLVHRGANVVHRLAHKHNYAQPETVDETTVVNRSLKKSDSSEYLTEPTLKPTKSIAKDDRLLAATQSKTITPPAPTSPKPMTIPGVGWRRSVLVNTNESESNSINADPIYNNVPNANRLKKKEMSIEDEGDLIEHDLLDLVEQEQQKELQRNNTPPPVPAKKRMAPTAPDNSLDIDIEPTTKLIHIGKDRPRRTNIKPPVKRGTNGGSHDSSSDGGLDNDDNSIGDNPPVSTNETLTTNLPNTSTTDPQTSELPPKTVTKLFKPTLKSTKATNDEPSPPPVPVKTQQHLSARPSNAQQQTNAPLTASKSVAVTNNDISQIINSDTTHEPIHTKPLMSMSSYAGFTPSNRDEQKETYNSSENVSSPVPPVLTRSGKAAIGTRVLPALDPNGEAPPVRLRHYPLDKKVSLPVNLPPVENTIESDTTPGAGDSNTSDDNEQYKRLSVKERARLLATTNPTMLPMEKKPITPPNTTEPTLKPTKSIAKDDRLLAATQSKTITPPAPTSPKPMTIPGVGWRRSVLVNTNESESNSINADPIYNNVPNANRLRKKEMSIEDEGDLIEHDLLDLVEQEQQKELQRNNTPPPVPAKKRIAPTAPDNNLDIDIEPTTKLIHIGKDRPRRTNIKPPVKRGTNGGSHDSSSDGGLDNDDNSIGDNPSVSTNETSTTNLPNTSTSDPQTSELPPKTVTKLFKPALKSTKATNDEPSPPPVPVKTQQHLSARPSNAQQQTNAPLTASKSVAVTNNDISQIINSDTTHEPIHTKPLMSMSSYAGFTPSNRDEQKETHNSSENVSSPVPPVLTRSGKAAIGTRVLPALDPNGEAPPVRLRHYPLDKKVSLPVNLPPVENTIESEITPGAGDSNTSDDNEQYKRLSVKERARLLATTNPTMLPMEKKPITPPNTTAGITSYGIGCALPEYAGVYTRVSVYEAWIKCFLENNT
ncbi:unnamed protein product, partial [Adineta steineri]